MNKNIEADTFVGRGKLLKQVHEALVALVSNMLYTREDTAIDLLQAVAPPLISMHYVITEQTGYRYAAVEDDDGD